MKALKRAGANLRRDIAYPVCFACGDPAALMNYVFDGSLRPTTEMLAGASDMFSEVFATSHDAAMPHIATHALAGLAHLAATRFHLSRGSRVIPLSNSIERRQGQRQCGQSQNLCGFVFDIHLSTMTLASR
jgi:hypothetical protein